jgi:L-alanine-DL-glutamate epimerase-like enolase superfamily enzyme
VPEIQDCHLILPDTPGWGTDPIESALAAHPPQAVRGITGRR